MRKQKSLNSVISLILSLLLVAFAVPFTAVAAGNVSYIGADGSAQSVTDYTVITSSTASLTTGWYVLNEDVTITSRITVTGTVNIVLCDGATLTAPKGISLTTGNALYIFGQSAQTGEIDVTGPETTYAGIGGYTSNSANNNIGILYINGGTLNVHGGAQAAAIGSGVLGTGGYITINRGTVYAYSNAGGGAAIGGGTQSSSGTVIINGGYVRAVADSVTAAYNGSGIGSGSMGQCNDITVNGGTVYAIGAYNAAGIGAGSNGNCVGTITVNGGSVYATGGEGAAAIGASYGNGFNTININGGYVEASKHSSGNGTGIGSGCNISANNTKPCQINLDWTNSTDRIFADSYSAKEINIGNLLVLEGTTTLATPDNIDNEWIAPYTGTLYDVKFLDDDGVTEIETAQQIIPGNLASEPATPVKFGCRFIEWQVGGVAYDFSTPVNTDLDIQAVWTYLTAVPYIDENGVEQNCQDYDLIEDSTIVSDYELNDGWYVVGADATLSGRIKINGDVKIILADGATLTDSKGISLYAGNSLTIYAQQNGTGTMNLLVPQSGSTYQYLTGIGATQSKAAGNLTINGGVINARGGFYASGIGGSDHASNGTVTINGGNVNATGGTYGAGIGGGFLLNNAGTVIINGGNVTAKGGSGAPGIGAGGQGQPGTITINGGTVSAKSGSNGAADIGGGITSRGGTLTINGGNVSTDGTNSYTGFGSGTNAPSGDPAVLNLAWTNSSDTVYISSSNAETVNITSDFYRTDVLTPVDSTNYTGDTLRTKPSVSYIESNGTTAVCTDIKGIIENSDSTDTVTLSGPGWYVVSGDVTVNGRIRTTSNVRIILMDGATLTAPKGITVGYRLTIYGQQEGTGELDITSPNSKCAGIGGVTSGSLNSPTTTDMSSYTITINGGIINVQGGDGAAAIGNAANGTSFGTITINGGKVNAVGGSYMNLNSNYTVYSGAGIGGDCNYCTSGTVRITGGQVTARGGITQVNKAIVATAAGIGGRVRTTNNVGILLSWKNLTDFVESSSYAVGSNLVNFNKTFYVDGTDTVATITNAAENKIVPYWTADYCEADGTVKTATGIQRITDSTEALTLTEGWVLVNEDATVSGRITTTEPINLILADGVTLTAPKGIGVNMGTSSLAIYAQQLGTGALVITSPDSCNAGIGGENGTYAGSIIINGGNITAQGSTYAPGIGAGASSTCKEIIINAGTVNATGGLGAAGIGGGFMSTSTGPIYINGGNITAQGGHSAYNSTFIITGIGAGTQKQGTTGDYTGDIYLNWNKADSSITSNGYKGTVHFVRPFILDAAGDREVATESNIGDDNTTVTIIPCPMGDIIVDDEVNLQDYAALHSYLSDSANNPLNNYQQTAADMDFDGALDMFDLYYIDRLAFETH